MVKVERPNSPGSSENSIDSLMRVGEKKPLGYLPLSTLKKRTGADPKVILQELLGKGLWARIYKKRESGIVSGALFAADLGALGKLLNDRSEVLTKNDWPSDPIEFIERSMKTEVPDFTQLFDLIADVYADKTNIGRTDVGGGRQ